MEAQSFETCYISYKKKIVFVKFRKGAAAHAAAPGLCNYFVFD